MNISGEIHVHKTETPIAELPVLDNVSGEEKLRVYDNGVAKSVLVSVLLDYVGGGVSSEAVALLGTILRAAMYTSNQSGNITALLTELSGGDTPSPEPEPEPEPAEDVTLSDGVLTIITTGATVSLSGGVLSFE